MAIRCTQCLKALSFVPTRPVRFASNSNGGKALNLKNVVGSEPPLPIRVALVSASTALCTPIFPAIGFVNICLRVMLPKETLRNQLSASIGSILSFACWTIVPFSYNIAPLMLPFAISNGVSAGLGYAMLDVSTGGPKHSKVLKNPILTGGGIGAFTGFIAPNVLYGEAYHLLYGIDSVTPVMKQLMASPFVTQISCTTGFFAGCTMYPLLHYPIFGIQSIPWTNFSGVLLLVSAATVYSIYKTDVGSHELIAPEGSFVKPEMVSSLNSIMRYNAQIKQYQSFSLTTKEWGHLKNCEKGLRIANSVRSYQRQTDSWGQTFTFDNPILSYLCHYVDRGIAERFPNNVVSLEDRRTLEKYQDIMCKTDLAVALINENNEILSTEKMIEEKVTELVQVHNDRREYQLRRLVRNIASVRVGVVLLMMMKQRDIKTIYHEHTKTILHRDDIELWVRRRAPEILLFESDETDHPFVKGESIENQLVKMEWQSEEIDQVLNAWVKISSNEWRTRWKVSGIAATIGAIATLFSQVLM